MSFSRMQWLFPIAVLLHNCEEAIWMPAWVVQHSGQLPVVPPGLDEIRRALLVLVVAAFMVTYLSARNGRDSLWSYLLFGSIVTMLANVFVPHVPASIVFRAYTPGVATAVLINLPLMTWLAVLAVRDKWVGGWRAAGFAVGVPTVIGGLVVALFWRLR
jgi:hypothetical protein